MPKFRTRMNELSFDIATQISEYMKHSGDMNQKDLARKLKKKESEISKWLQGGHNFTISTIAKIEQVFGKKILIVPLFAEEDLGLKYEKTPSIELHISVATIETQMSQLLKSKPTNYGYLTPIQNKTTSKQVTIN